jgi:hypothetical protein
MPFRPGAAGTDLEEDQIQFSPPAGTKPWMATAAEGVESYLSSGTGFRTGQVGLRSLELCKLRIMTPKPPSSSEGSSLPPRSRPNLGDLAKDTTESDLWAFDDLDPVEEEATPPPSPPASSSIPVPRDRRREKKPIEQTGSPPMKPVKGKESIRVDVSREPSKAPAGSTAGQSPPRNDFDDLDSLDHWDENESPQLSIHSSLIVATTAAKEPVIEKSAPPVEKSDEPSATVPEAANPTSLVPGLGLTKLERIGLGALGAILLVGGGLVFFNSIYRLPSGAERLKAGDFPVKGSHVTILSAETFWRAPITEGENAETFRRGTQLLPVVNLTSSGGPAAVRVFFRDEDGLVMGDAVTRMIKPGTPLQIGATAGFDDVGMHAAYRTGQSKPWTIEVLEGPSESAANAEFKKLFEINISTDRR